MLEEYEITKYDGLLIDGMTAVGYIKKIVGGYELPVIVEVEQNEIIVRERNEFGMLRDVDSEKYINPYAIFRCQVIRDENEVIIEIRLLKEQEGV
jgi:hypothetical protein